MSSTPRNCISGVALSSLSASGGGRRIGEGELAGREAPAIASAAKAERRAVRRARAAFRQAANLHRAILPFESRGDKAGFMRDDRDGRRESRANDKAARRP